MPALSCVYPHSSNERRDIDVQISQCQTLLLCRILQAHALPIRMHDRLLLPLGGRRYKEGQGR
jgi:hypothetical protein